MRHTVDDESRQAAASSPPAQRMFVSRLLETFFRRWWLYALALALFVGLGAASILRQTEQYTTSGVITVSGETLLGELTAVRGGTQFGYETPATYTSRQINTLLGTDVFLQSIIERAGLTTAVESGTVLIDDLRSWVWASEQGDVLVRINAATDNPELSYRLASATIEGYVQWEIDDSITESRSAEQFFEELLGPYQQELDAAVEAQAAYVEDHPGVADLTLRPLDEEIELRRLEEAVTHATEQYNTAKRSLDEARLATAQATTDITQRLRVVDQPRVPTGPQPHLRDDAMTMALFLALGGLVVAAALVVATLSDSTVRYPEEVEHRLNLPVLAVISGSGRRVRTSDY